MKKSIMQDDYTVCYLCGRVGNGDPLEEHHIFGGPNRKYSEKDGLKVRLCGDRCHRNGKMSIHRNSEISGKLKAATQTAWLIKYGNQAEFMSRYGRNYLEQIQE